MWRRIVLWALGLAFAALVLLVVIGALVGTTKKAKGGTNTVASAPAPGILGSRAQPVPLGRSFAIGDGWRLRVVWRKSNVSQTALGIRGQPLSPGLENVLVRLTITYLGDGSAEVFQTLDNLHVVGASHALVSPDGACSAPAATDFPNEGYFSLHRGQSVTGTQCVLISASDSSSIELYALSPDNTSYPAVYPPPITAVWFSLR
jgi:hypothetical protein